MRNYLFLSVFIAPFFTFLSDSHAVSGGFNGGGGGGIANPATQEIVPLSAYPTLQLEKNSKMATISPAILEATVRRTEVFREFLSPEVYNRLIHHLVKRDFIRVPSLPDTIRKKLENQYRTYVKQVAQPEQFRVVAYTSRSRGSEMPMDTFLLPEWDSVQSELDQVIYLYHEAYYSMTYADVDLAHVLKFEKLARAVLTQPDDTESKIEFVLSFPSTTTEEKFKMIVKIFELTGNPLRLSEIYDERMILPVTLTNSKCEVNTRLEMGGRYYGQDPTQTGGSSPYSSEYVLSHRQLVQLQNTRSPALARAMQSWRKIGMVDSFLVSQKPNFKDWGGMHPIECRYKNSHFNNFILTTQTVHYEQIPTAAKRMAMSIFPRPGPYVPLKNWEHIVVVPLNAETTDYYNSEVRRFSPPETTPIFIKF